MLLCPQKSIYSQSCGFSSSHVQMWDLDNKKGWGPKNSCLQTMVLEKILESPLDCKEIQPVNPKRNQSWIVIRRTDAKAEAPVLWPPDAKSQLIGKDPDAWKDWRQEGKGMTEDELVGWHHRLNGHESEQTLGDSDGQGSQGSQGTPQSMESQRVGHDSVTEQQQPPEKILLQLFDICHP